MIEVEGDFWELYKAPDVDLIVCTTNNIIKNDGSLVMGAGIAAQFKNFFKFVDFTWGKQIAKLDKDYLFMLDGPRNVGHNSIYLGALQTKRDWKDPSDIELIVNSCKKMNKICDLLGFKKILMTRPGCGNGGLKWAQVKNKLKFLDDRFIIVSNESQE